MGSAPWEDMRLGLFIVGAMLAMGLSRTAAAEQRVTSAWAQPALEAKLLDGWRGRESRLHLGGPSASQPESAEPGQELSLAVERMWSQVRAYKRRGGAELIVRGTF